MTRVTRARRVDRISAGDALQLATDVGPFPMNIAAVLTLGPGAWASDVEQTLWRRAASIGRLRQVLVSPAPGLGRPHWVEHTAFDVQSHVTSRRGPDRDDTDALLRIAVEAMSSPLPRDRPLWRAVVVTDRDGEAVAVVLVLHHVLADGIGGLAVLARLVDGAEPGTIPTEAGRQAAPGIPDLLRDRIGELARALRGLPSTLTRLRRGHAELGAHQGERAPRTSLNRPTGPRRRIAAVTVDLDSVHTEARRHGATVNDAVLVAVTSAMGEVLRRRGEPVEELVVSVPVSARTHTAGGDLGNQVGVMPVRVPLSGTTASRLTEVARRTRAQKTQTRGASAALIGPVFRLFTAVGLFHRFVDRQRLVNSFLTNLAGPAQELSFAGARIRRVVPVTATAGNVGVAFAALSYAGNLGVTVIADPAVVPEVDALARFLRLELGALAEPTSSSVAAAH